MCNYFQFYLELLIYFKTKYGRQTFEFDIVDHTKLIGLIVSNDLYWSRNTLSLIKRANSKMEYSTGTVLLARKTVIILGSTEECIKKYFKRKIFKFKKIL